MSDPRGGYTHLLRHTTHTTLSQIPVGYGRLFILGWARLFLMFNYAVPECPDVTLLPGFPLFFFFNYLISLLSAVTTRVPLLS